MTLGAVVRAGPIPRTARDRAGHRSHVGKVLLHDVEQFHFEHEGCARFDRGW